MTGDLYRLEMWVGELLGATLTTRLPSHVASTLVLDETDCAELEDDELTAFMDAIYAGPMYESLRLALGLPDIARAWMVRHQGPAASNKQLSLLVEKLPPHPSARQREAGSGIHCCTAMNAAVNTTCDMHPDRSDCADCLVGYYPNKSDYGLLIHDGGSSYQRIHFCPWCGARLARPLMSDNAS